MRGIFQRASAMQLCREAAEFFKPGELNPSAAINVIRQNNAAQRVRVAVMAAGFLSALVGAGQAQAQMSLPGSFEVSDTGAATYTIPITVPPGTAGMQPSLALVYNSQGGNGVLGMGWSLAGLPSISRCPKTIAQDGASGGVNYFADERFCLEGQRLIAISGVNGADLTEYRTEREGFSKIVSYGTAGSGPSWFKVWTKSGQVMEFGNTPDSKVEAQGRATVRLWAVNKISDTKGNYISVTYDEDNVNAQHYPNRIDYTGNTAAGAATFASVRFTPYVSRPPSEFFPAYQGGSMIKLPDLITHIRTYVGETLVRDYQFTYEQNPISLQSRVTTIKACNVDGTCLAPTTLDWQNGSQSIGYAGAASTGGNAADLPARRDRYFTMDVDGDGQLDFVVRYSSGGVNRLVVFLSDNGAFTYSGYVDDPVFSDSLPVQDERYFIMDVNGDGRADFVARDTAGNLAVFLSNGSTFTYSSTTPTGGAAAELPLHGQRYFLMDVNGDGKSDFVVRYSTGGVSRLIVFLANGTGFTGAGFLDDPVFSDNLPDQGKRYFVLDANGDGLSDFVTRDTVGNLGVFLSTGTSFVYGGTTSTAAAATDLQARADRYFQMDVNGDGRDDIVIRYSSGGADRLIVFLVNGTSFTYSGYVEGAIFSDNLPVSDQRFFLMDVNGDGKLDIVSRDTAGNLGVFLSNGETFTYASTTATGAAAADLPVHGQRYFVMDVNGDGRQDLLVRYSASGVSRIILLVANGTGFNAGGYLDDPVFSDNLPDQGARYFAMDVNGDGKTDFVTRDTAGTLGVWKSWGSAPKGVFPTLGIAPDLLISVANGLGAETAMRYATIGEVGANSVYTKDTGAVFPEVDIRGPLFVVAEVKATDGIGGMYRSTYKYAGARAHARGRGFLGFREVSVKDEQTLIEQATNYLRTFPYTGLMASRTKKLSATTLNETVNTFNATALGGTRSFVFLQQSIEKSWELNGSLVSQVTTQHTYDTFGNATTVTVSTPDGYSKTTTNIYENNTTFWLLGRLTKASVTSVTP